MSSPETAAKRLMAARKACLDAAEQQASGGQIEAALLRAATAAGREAKAVRAEVRACEAQGEFLAV